MRSLFIKITVGFVLVSLVGAGLAAIFIQQRTHSAFDRFLFDQSKNATIDMLTQYYQNTGSWANVESVFLEETYLQAENPENPPRDNDRRFPFDPNRLPYILVDSNGFVVFGRAERIDQPVPQKDLNKGIALKVDGQTVGWLLSPRLSAPDYQRDTPQGNFLRDVNQSILLSAAIAFALALALGSLVARSLTSPLRELAAATRQVAKGKLGYKVKVRSKDEIGQLANSFNQMSEDLDKSNQLRKQMTADIAHDLRTPLSIIMGYTEALSDGKLAGSPEMYTTMHEMAQHLSHLIDDLRTLSLADAGELPISLEEISPVRLLERAAAAHSSQAQVKNISLEVVADPNIPSIDVDPGRMAQVLGNLVSNALRYTPEGGRIELSAKLAGDEVCIFVSDNGRGIAPEELPLIFTRFYRGDKSRQDNGDAGLGLTIAKSLVEMHRGTISVESELEKGTTFIIRLPLHSSKNAVSAST